MSALQPQWKEYTVTLETLSPLHIGATRDVFTSIENSIVRLQNQAIVPSTTLKGAWRNQIERFLIGEYYDSSKKEWRKAGVQPCIPGRASDDEKRILNDKQWVEAKRRSEIREYREYKEPCTYNKYGDPICPACYLLGAQTLLGFVRVPFLKLAEGQDRTDEELYSLRIDRETETGVEGANRSWYVVNAGIRFVGTLQVLQRDDLRHWTLGQARTLGARGKVDRWLDDPAWTAQAIYDKLIKGCLESISIIGGFRSKDCGKVKITVMSK